MKTLKSVLIALSIVVALLFVSVFLVQGFKNEAIMLEERVNE